MVDRSIAQSLCELVVFFLVHIDVSFFQKNYGFMEPSHVFRPFIYGRMPVDILAVINGCLFNVVDRTIDLIDSLDLVLRTDPVARAMLDDHPTRRSQIRKSVKVGGAALWRSNTTSKSYDPDHQSGKANVHLHFFLV
jgi:hypothetical protein